MLSKTHFWITELVNGRASWTARQYALLAVLPHLAHLLSAWGPIPPPSCDQSGANS